MDGWKHKRFEMKKRTVVMIIAMFFGCLLECLIFKETTGHAAGILSLFTRIHLFRSYFHCKRNGRLGESGFNPVVQVDRCSAGSCPGSVRSPSDYGEGRETFAVESISRRDSMPLPTTLVATTNSPLCTAFTMLARSRSWWVV